MSPCGEQPLLPGGTGLAGSEELLGIAGTEQIADMNPAPVTGKAPLAARLWFK